MQRKYKILSLVLIAAFAISAVASSPTIASWIGNSVAKITSTTATVSFTTTIVGIATNAATNPITINGGSYGGSASPITNFVQGPNGGDPSSPSTVTLSTGGFIPGDYALFKVTITNTGSATLAFSNYQVLSEFVDSSGNSIAYTFPPSDPYNHGYTAPANPAPAFNGPISDFWDTASTEAAMTTTFQSYITNNAIAGCASTWCEDNALIGTSAPSSGTTLAHGATFSYYIYIGLGAETVYGIPAALYTVTIPLTAAN